MSPLASRKGLAFEYSRLGVQPDMRVDTKRQTHVTVVGTVPYLRKSQLS